MSNFVAVLDACVLYPVSLRDTLLRAAGAGLYRVQLTNEILEEVQRNLIKKGMKEAKTERLIRTIKEHFSDAFVTQHRLIITSMTNHVKDRHVLAAAVVSRAQVIVTQNLRDFPEDSLAPHTLFGSRELVCDRKSATQQYMSVHELVVRVHSTSRLSFLPHD